MLAEGHALLALALLSQKRVHAAEYEAREALRLEPDLLTGLQVLASVAMLRSRLKEAEEHTTRLLELAPEEPALWRLLAQLRDLQGRPKDRHEALLHALSLNAADPDTLVDLGEEALERGNVMEAERRAREALALTPEHPDGLVLMGRVLLWQGHLSAAHEHAVWALRQNATNGAALRLLVGIKARRSWWMGLWWRFNTWMEMLGPTRSTLVLLVAYVLSRVATLGAEDLGSPEGARAVQWVWLALVVYSWVAPGLFQRMLRKELTEVRLKAGF